MVSDQWEDQQERTRATTAEAALAEERATRPPLTTWRGKCGHLWVRDAAEDTPCPTCKAEAERDRLAGEVGEARVLLVSLAHALGVHADDGLLAAMDAWLARTSPSAEEGEG